MTALITDHEAEALARLPSRYREQENIEHLVRVLVGPVQALEQALWELLTERGIETGSGVTLDQIGEIIGQPRPASATDDDDYRPYLRARIATNRSTGTVADVIRVARALLNDPAVRVVVRQPGIAAATVTLEDAAVSDELADVLIHFLGEVSAKGAGVRMILHSSAAEPEATMRWDTDGQGWDEAVWASARDSSE